MDTDYFLYINIAHNLYNNNICILLHNLMNLFLLDEVYSRLGLDMTKLHEERAEGRQYGWTLNGYAEPGTDNDNFISFGILEYNDTQHKLFRAGQINDITLHFNCRLLTKETNELLAKG